MAGDVTRNECRKLSRKKKLAYVNHTRGRVTSWEVFCRQVHMALTSHAAPPKLLIERPTYVNNMHPYYDA